MALMQLPTELLQLIIPHTLPEGFESLVLTCKFLCELCTPFLGHYNNLRFHFRKFECLEPHNTVRELRFHDGWLRRPDTVSSAYGLISRIAIEPAVGRYILEADLSLVRVSMFWQLIHSGFSLNLPQNAESDTWRDRDESVRQLFAESLYLRKAGLDWKKFYRAMMKDVKRRRQSEYAGAFALTLLPNVQVLTPAFFSFPSSEPKRLISAILQTARQNPRGDSSLAQVTTYSGSCGIPWIYSVLALPRITSFWGDGGFFKTKNEILIEAEYLGSGLDSRLQVAGFRDMSADAEDIAGFLRHTPRLKSLRYWHSTKARRQKDWDLCSFIAAVQHEVGTHLEHLCATTFELPCLITPGKPCLRGFQRLKSLELSLDIVLCNPEAVHPADHGTLDSNPLLGDIVPASVSILSLLSLGKRPHDKALELLFHDFANQKQLQTPNLKKISLSCPSDADDLYKAQCANLKVEAKRAGTDLTISKRSPWGMSNFRQFGLGRR